MTRPLALAFTIFCAASAVAHDLDLTYIRVFEGSSTRTVRVVAPWSRLVRTSRLNPDDAWIGADQEIKRRLGIPATTQSHLKLVDATDMFEWSATVSPSVPLNLDRFDVSTRAAQTIVERSTMSDAIQYRNETPRSVGAFFAAGLNHILCGIDHLLFLLGLVLAQLVSKELIRTLTAFTLAHTVGLAIAVSAHGINLSRWVEPLIALSIAVIALEGLRMRPAEATRRGLIVPAVLTACFGVVHGLGFGAGLRGLLNSDNPGFLPWLQFTMGIEFGQIAVVFPAVLVLRWSTRRSHKWAHRARTAIAILLAMTGTFWMFARIVNPSM